jgi:hypothetical protein
VGWEACLGFSSGFENSALDDVFGLGAEIAGNFNENIGRGGGLRLVVAKVDGFFASLDRGGV